MSDAPGRSWTSAQHQGSLQGGTEGGEKGGPERHSEQEDEEEQGEGGAGRGRGVRGGDRFFCVSLRLSYTVKAGIGRAGGGQG